MTNINDDQFIVPTINIQKIRNPIALAIYIYYQSAYGHSSISVKQVLQQFNITKNEYDKSISYLQSVGVE